MKILSWVQIGQVCTYQPKGKIEKYCVVVNKTKTSFFLYGIEKSDSSSNLTQINENFEDYKPLLHAANARIGMKLIHNVDLVKADFKKRFKTISKYRDDGISGIIYEDGGWDYLASMTNYSNYKEKCTECNSSFNEFNN